MATESEVEVILRMLVDAYPDWAREQGAEQLKRTFTVYTMLLSDMPEGLLRAAAVQHAAASKWFPKAAELRDLAQFLGTKQLASPVDAWAEVTQARRRWDRYANNGNAALPEFSNPIIARIVRAMGMIALQDSENEVADRARFIEEYQALVSRADTEQRLLPQVREVRERLTGGNGKIAGLLADTAGKMRHD